MATLDAIEFEGLSVREALARLARDRRCLPAHQRWAAEAVGRYLQMREQYEAARRVEGRPATRPVKHQWSVIAKRDQADERGARRYERTAWGRRYASEDGSERELWLLSVNTLRTDRSEAEKAEAACVLARGVPVQSAFGDIHRPLADAPRLPRQVRVVGFGCGDGSHGILEDMSAEQAEQAYADRAREVLGRAVDSRSTRPGSSCVRCEALTGCTAVIRAPGILGVPAPRHFRKRRSLSTTDLRVHAVCPARYHLTRTLRLKPDAEESEAIRRGRAVDTWLNEQHVHGSCFHAPLPSALPGLSADAEAQALSMLAEHQSCCPLRSLPAGARVRVQPRLTVHDPELDVVLIADPDLLYAQGGGWVWHETKTASRRPWEGASLLQSYPQLAVAVLMIEAGALESDPRRCRIDLEVLHGQGPWYGEVDPADPGTLDEARRVVAELAASWVSDETYPARPGRHCAECEVRSCCPDASSPDTE
ncbi:PD-(D/E)XK nuclease family protein [Streptomyces sp. MST-110588]|uniref:PD-(D/E)XK nuclease family protein n=1 Tax=Streptomyces sp. MST-110588 TaxID=2833628 RepID=UPI001F5C45C3|nr:PD-(D/E)XK nuclease family protein [Streptomyces sp. MST-110588]UNO39414.1 PD-(D/E)XK nuclease family protein [Streptomyces sp. MST-110588]